MAKKFYAVRKGMAPGIYENWDDAKAQVNGFAGAEYKGFMTRSEAENYMGEALAGIDASDLKSEDISEHDEAYEPPHP